MKRQYFGTDGIRGTVGQAPMTPDFILRLGQAAGVVIARYASNAPQGLERKRPCVLIGKDTRVSGYLLESCLEAGLTSMGVDVVLVGPMPTAAIAYLTKTLSMAAGIVISASHNPYPDNGIKFFSAQGTKLPDAWELAIEEALEQSLPCKPSEQLGKAKRLNDAAGRYIEFCKSTFVRDQQAGLSNLAGLKIVVDCAHGAAYHIAPAVFRELGAEVVSIADEPNGLNINEGVGATHPEPLANMVRAYGADYGFALDGDADRVVCVDAAGRVYNGDELLYVLVQERLARGVPVPGVVGTLMSNMALELALKRLGIAFERAKVGDRYVYERLQQQGWQLGGEASGHLLMLDVHSTGDGIVSALHVLRAVRALGQPLAAILQDMPLMPQVLKNAHLPQGYEWQSDAHLQSACAAVAQQLQGQGRLLVRPSGTEPLLRVMAEAPSLEQAQAAVDAVLAALPAV